MIDVFIVIGLILLFLGSLVLFALGGYDFEVNGHSIRSVLLIMGGIITFALWFISLKTVSDHKHKRYEETHPTEIVTSIPPQIDTTIITKNGVSDTTYTYIFQKPFINSK